MCTHARAHTHTHTHTHTKTDRHRYAHTHTRTRTHARTQIRELMAKAFKGVLTSEESQLICDAFESDAKVVYHCGLTPKKLPDLVCVCVRACVRAFVRAWMKS